MEHSFLTLILLMELAALMDFIMISERITEILIL